MVTGLFRTVCNLTLAAVRVALPDGWDAQLLPARCHDGNVTPGGWEGRSTKGGRVVAPTAEKLLAKLWAIEARAADTDGMDFGQED